MSKMRVAWKPRARNDVVIRELPDELLVYSRHTNSAHCLNATAAFVWKHCDGKTTVAEMSSAVQKQTTLPNTHKLVWMALDRLDSANLLLERIPRPAAKKILSRREVIRKLGTAALVALPLVTSVIL